MAIAKIENTTLADDWSRTSSGLRERKNKPPIPTTFSNFISLVFYKRKFILVNWLVQPAAKEKPRRSGDRPPHKRRA